MNPKEKVCSLRWHEQLKLPSTFKAAQELGALHELTVRVSLQTQASDSDSAA